MTIFGEVAKAPLNSSLCLYDLMKSFWITSYVELTLGLDVFILHVLLLKIFLTCVLKYLSSESTS